MEWFCAANFCRVYILNTYTIFVAKILIYIFINVFISQKTYESSNWYFTLKFVLDSVINIIMTKLLKFLFGFFISNDYFTFLPTFLLTSCPVLILPFITCSRSSEVWSTTASLNSSHHIADILTWNFCKLSDALWTQPFEELYTRCHFSTWRMPCSRNNMFDQFRPANVS